MTDRLLMLAECCEQATAPQEDGGYALNSDIAKAVGWTYRQRDGFSVWQWYAPRANDGWGNGGEKRAMPPAFTSSLDAALTLVPEGWEVNLSFGTGFARVYLVNSATGTSCGGSLIATPALALCAAALKARAARAIEARRDGTAKTGPVGDESAVA